MEALSTVFHEPKRTLTGHTNWITIVAEVAPGETIITASGDKTMKLWSIENGSCIWSIDFDGWVEDAAVVDENTVIAVSGRSVFIVDASRGKILTKSQLDYFYSCVAIGKTEAVLGSWLGTVMKISWNGGKVKVVKTIEKAHKHLIQKICKHGDQVVSCSADGTAKLWRVKSLKLVRTFRGHEDAVLDVSFDDKYVVTCSGDKKILVFDVNTARIVTHIKTSVDFVYFVSILPNENAVVFGGVDEVIAYHDLSSGECIKKYEIEMKAGRGTLLSSGLVAVAVSPTRNVVVFDFNQRPEQERSVVAKDTLSVLELAFNQALSNPSMLTYEFVSDNVQQQNIRSAHDLLCGHNILLFAIRSHVLTLDQIRNFNNNLRYFEDNLYHPASKLLDENPNLLYPIFRHAQHVGIIRNSLIFQGFHEVRVDMQLQFDSLRQSITELSARLSRHTEAIEANTQNFQSLFDAIKRKEKYMQYAGIAKVLLSLIPVLGKAFSDAAYAGADVLFGLAVEDLVGTGIEILKAGAGEFIDVDLSSAHVTYCVLSETGMEKLSEETRTLITTAVSRSDFETMETLRQLLMEVIQGGVNEEVEGNVLEMESSKGTGNEGENIVVTVEEEEETETIVREQFQMVSNELKLKNLTIFEAAKAMNTTFEKLRVHKTTDADEFELNLVELSKKTTVSEDLFVDVFRVIMSRIAVAVDEEQLIEEYRNIFDITNKGRSSTGIKFAMNVLIQAGDDLKKRGLLGDRQLSDIVITEELVAKFDKDGHGKVDRIEFVDAGLFLMHGIARK